MITQADVKQMFDYDPETGDLVRRLDRGTTYKAGAVAGTIQGNGYRTVYIKGKIYGAHRIVWLWCHGEWPEHQIDHIDRNKLNNRIENLRDVPASVNSLNQDKRASASGFKGVRRSRKRWSAEIRKDGNVVHLGTFDTPEMAFEAFKAAHAKIHGPNSEYFKAAA